jgi:N-acetylated-alpha-linked acidic dipeptidase
MSHPNLRLRAALLAALAVPAPVATAQDPPPVAVPAASAAGILGFAAADAAAQRERELALDGRISRDEMREWMRRLTARPHHLGSEWGRANAEWMRDLLSGWGYDARLETFRVLFPTPRERRLELVAPTRFRARLTEPALAADATSAQATEQLPTYNAYSVDGDVEGELVYVNYGLPTDYDELTQRGVDVAGKVVIARYGGSWRGIKPKVAAEHGAIGCIIYSDPGSDGWRQGDVYPKGGWRNSESVQRGSVSDMPIRVGDPLTPGIGATADAARRPLSEIETLTRIPTLPISAADAEPLLRALGGPMAPEAWRGALPLPYRLGAGPARVRLKVAFDWNQVELHDVIATLPGRELADEWVIHGNHHDAWVNGASDPISGMVALLAEAKAIGELARAGWRPRRTLVYAAWDGEEPGLLGSTEWAETHHDELRAKGVAYLNTDSLSRGIFSPAGSHSLERFVHEAAAEVADPEIGVPVGERSRAARIAAAEPKDRAKLRERLDYRIDALGSGSDYTPFLQHLTLSALNVGFGGESPGGVYHSAYDTVKWYQTHSDGDYAYGRTLSQITGTLILRLSEAPVLPFQFVDTADTLLRYVVELEKLAATKKDSKVDMRPVRNAVEALKKAGEAYEKAYASVPRANSAQLLGRRELQELNKLLLTSEQKLGNTEGLPRREWFKHQMYAPGFYTGYGVKTMPQIREGLEENRFTEAQGGVRTVSAAVNALATQVNEAAKALEQAVR